jgi:molybdopterin/thiamine biosynthesis adenylyltransferase
MAKNASHLQLDAEDRFDRLRRIAWWDQEKLMAAKILVVGAGALGNEILKNLALLGIGNLFLADMDSIEPSNLSRSILYRERDMGRSKAEVAAAAVKDIYPTANVHFFHGDVIYELGLGVYDWADLVLAGLDSREARLHVNQCCWKTKTPWIDGATETLQGVVRMFVPPTGPCYECTLTTADWELLQERRGCAGLRAERPPGRVSTTPTTASVIAALQCQEAVKWLHGLDGLARKGLVFNGVTNDTYVVPYNIQEDCNSHETFEEIVRLPGSVHTVSLRQVLAEARTRLGPGAVVEFEHEILLSFECPSCLESEMIWRPLGSVSEREAACPRCGTERRPESTQSIHGSEDYLDRPFAAMGVPPFDMVLGRKGFSAIAFAFAGDGPTVLGPLHAQPVQE